MSWPYIKNQINQFDFPLFDSVGDLVNVSGTITTQVALDGQTFLSVSGNVQQYGTTGVYKFYGTAEDWNADRATFKITTPEAKPAILSFHTDSKQFQDIPSLADLKAQCENAITAFDPIKTSTSGRLLDVSAGGEAGVDWANVGTPGSSVNLSSTTVGIIGASGISPSSMGADVREQIAADTLKRGLVRDETVFETRSVGWALSKLANKVSSSAGVLTIYQTDDSTALFTQNISTSGGAAPITTLDTN